MSDEQVEQMVDEVLKEQEEKPAAKGKRSKAQSIQEKMGKERKAKVAKARAEIDAEDKKRFSEDDKQARENRASVKRQTADRQAREKEKAAVAEKSTGKPKGKAKGKVGATAKLSDEELSAAIKKVLAKDAATSPSGMVKAVRAAGHSAAGKRIRALHTKLAKPAKATKAKK